MNLGGRGGADFACPCAMMPATVSEVPEVVPECLLNRRKNEAVQLLGFSRARPPISSCTRAQEIVGADSPSSDSHRLGRVTWVLES